MLEHPALLLQRQASRSWIIRDPDGAVLGCARWETGADQGWRRWLNRLQLAFYETEDQSLLCTLNRRWLPSLGWVVRDADGQRVGAVRGAVIWDRFGNWLATVEKSPNRDVFRFLDPDRQELASMTRSEQGTNLAFAGMLDLNPFTKMVLLAAVFALEETFEHDDSTGLSRK